MSNSVLLNHKFGSVIFGLTIPLCIFTSFYIVMCGIGAENHSFLPLILFIGLCFVFMYQPSNNVIRNSFSKVINSINNLATIFNILGFLFIWVDCSNLFNINSKLNHVLSINNITTIVCLSMVFINIVFIIFSFILYYTDSVK